MKLEVRLFATLKVRAGRDQIVISLPEPATVRELLTGIAGAYPNLATALPTSIVAVNKAFATPETELEPEDEIALFPPVSGGDGNEGRPTYFSTTSVQVDLNEIQAKLSRPDIGAIVTFTGRVRGETSRSGLPPNTLYLEYEAYSEMAEVKMAQIAKEIWQRWPLVKGIAIVQRIGKLEIGATTTIVACSAAHRDQGAFEAARYGIDRLKEIVPIWKKEVGQDHSAWIEGDYRPTEDDN